MSLSLIKFLNLATTVLCSPGGAAAFILGLAFGFRKLAEELGLIPNDDIVKGRVSIQLPYTQAHFHTPSESDLGTIFARTFLMSKSSTKMRVADLFTHFFSAYSGLSLWIFISVQISSHPPRSPAPFETIYDTLRYVHETFLLFLH